MSPSVRTVTRSSCLALAIVAALFPIHAALSVPVVAVNESNRTPASEAPSNPAEQARTLDTVRVEGKRIGDRVPAFPATQAAVDRERIEDTINAVDVQDAARYLPSVFLRKRNFGDTQATLATRTWGVNSSARTLVFIDDIPVSALIANNNSIGAPRWGVISPETIDHIDMLYGPFSAAYAGNSIGGVLRITTRQPDRTEVTFKQTLALQTFDQYGTKGDYSTRQSSLTAGGRHGALSWFVGANLQGSDSQPLAYITTAHAPAGTTGTFPANNKLGQPANVVGAGGLLQTRMLNLDGMLSYDITPALRATYLIGYWSNDARSHVDSYLRDADGQPTFGGVASFASNAYTVDSRHLMQAFSLKTSTQGAFDGAVVVSRYDFLKDRQLSAAAVATGTDPSANGRRADYAGTGWTTFDATGTWRQSGGNDGTHEVSFGVHADDYALDNPTYDTANRLDPDSVTGVFSAGRGRTRTQALWLQDAWRFAPDWLATAGVRAERWRASDGFNASGGIAVVQPRASESAFSPKLSVQWDVADDWRVTGSLARAVRFPTVGELYQLVSTGSTFTMPNPDLGPEYVRSGELAFEHALDRGSLRLSLFQENTRDALVSQTAFLPGVTVPVSYVLNVGELRSRGIELAAQENDVLFDGLELSGSVTVVDAEILSNDAFASTAGTTSTGKHVPNVPRWRATAVATYRPDEHWAFTLAGRYSGRQYSTLDNTDNAAHVFGAFDSFRVFDARVHYRINDRLAVSFGIDNFTNEEYFLYHPFPQRTYVLDFKYSL